MKTPAKILFCLSLFISAFGNAQKLKLIKLESYFKYDFQKKYTQLNYSYERHQYDLNLIYFRDEIDKTDSVICINAKLNKHARLIDSVLIRDESGRKSAEGFYLDTLVPTNDFLYTPYSFYSLSGTKSGKHFTYDYSSDEKGAERLIYLSEEYFLGKKHGEFIAYFPESKQLSELKNYQDDVLHGSYVKYNKDGTIKEKGEYKNNLKNGSWINYSSNNQAEEYQQYENGKRHGQHKKWHPNSNLSIMANYQHNVKDGFYFSYYPNKQRKDSCFYNQGNLHGKSVSYHENGKLKTVSEYKDGSPVADHKYWDEKGQLLVLIEYRFGFINGKVMRYFPNGKISESYRMIKNILEGEYLIYYENGQLKSKVNYKNGIPQKGAQYFDSSGKKLKMNPPKKEEELFPEEIIQEEEIQIPLDPLTNLTLQPAEVSFTEIKNKDHLKLIRKLKGTEIRLRIDKYGNKTMQIQSPKIKSKIKNEAITVLPSYLKITPLKLNEYPVDCTVTLILE